MGTLASVLERSSVDTYKNHDVIPYQMGVEIVPEVRKNEGLASVRTRAPTFGYPRSGIPVPRRLWYRSSHKVADVGTPNVRGTLRDGFGTSAVMRGLILGGHCFQPRLHAQALQPVASGDVVGGESRYALAQSARFLVADQHLAKRDRLE